MHLQDLKVGNVLPVPSLPKPEKEIVSSWKGDLSKPLVSIVCITYNHINFIENALNSLLNQVTSFPFEIILHDDASTDGTTKIVEKYAKNYPNIIVPIIQTKNQWSQGKRPSQFTFAVTRGQYIAMCEGDDFWVSKDKIQLQFNYMSNNPEATLCFHDAVTTNQQLQVIKFNQYSEVELEFNVSDIIDKWFISTQTIFFEKTPILESNEYFKGVINGDWLIQLMSAHHGKVVFLPNILACYRKHPDSLSTQVGRDKAYRAMKLIRLFFLFDMFTGFKYSDQIDEKVMFYLDEYHQFQRNDEFNSKKVLYVLHPKLFAKRLSNKIKRYITKYEL